MLVHILENQGLTNGWLVVLSRALVAMATGSNLEIERTVDPVIGSRLVLKDTREGRS